MKEPEKSQNNSDQTTAYPNKKLYLRGILIFSLLIALGIILFSNLFYVVIPAGHKGVRFSSLGGGTQVNKIFDEGLKLKAPWDKIISYDTRIQKHHDTIQLLTKNGVEIKAEISLLYTPNAQKLGQLHKEVGTGYLNTVLIPRITANIREMISQYNVNSLHSTNSKTIQEEVIQLSQKQVSQKYPIEIIDVIIHRIILPNKVSESINNKLVLEQEALHKKIEAQGIYDFTNTAQIDILKWEGIKATKDLVNSPNTKTIIIGTNNDELPIILGGNN